MAGDWTVEIKGLDELERALSALPDQMQAAPMRSSLKVAAMVIQEGMRIRAPRDPHVQDPTLAEDIGYTVNVSTKRWWAFAQIGPRKRVFYGGFMELGVASRGITPRPFMRPALDEDGQIAVAAFANEMRRAIYRAAGRLARKVAAFA